MKLLDKVREAGYNVVTNRTKSGIRSIYVSGNGAWIICRIKPGCYSEVKHKIEFLRKSLCMLLQNKND